MLLFSSLARLKNDNLAMIPDGSAPRSMVVSDGEEERREGAQDEQTEFGVFETVRGYRGFAAGLL